MSSSAARAGKTLATSAGLGWRDVQLERYLLPPLSKPVKCLPDTYVGLIIGRTCEIDWRIAGRPERARLAPGEVWLMPANVDASLAWSEHHETIRVELRQDLLTQIAAELRPNRQALEPAVRRQDAGIAQVMLALATEAEDPGAASGLLADSLAVELAVRLLRAERKPSKGTPPGLRRSALRATCEFIEARLGESLDLNAMAAVAGVTVWHFARQFRASTGVTPHAYATARRVARAKLLLRNESANIVDVASAVGFASPSHFAKVFARATGLTPLAWRRAR